MDNPKRFTHEWYALLAMRAKEKLCNKCGNGNTCCGDSSEGYYCDEHCGPEGKGH